MILDFHIHSHHSADSLCKPVNILRAANQAGLNGVAVTDHSTIAGGLETSRLNDDPNFLVIVGCEIYTEVGDIIGLFLTEEIQSRNSLEVIREIHGQGGLALLPHPGKWHKLNDEVIQAVDLIEIFNSRTDLPLNQQAAALAERHAKPTVVGSDAHFCKEIGLSRVTIPGKDIRRELLTGAVEFETRESPPYFQHISQIIKVVKSRQYHRLPRSLAGLVVKGILGRRSLRTSAQS
jgi:predicted metal-dependent phosphoesterase TrpH